jgi:hypothetical protein
MPDTSLSTLDNIRVKVRRLTRSPSTTQLLDSDIDNYVNNFVLYDFPENLRLFDLRDNIVFYTSPYIDKYSNNTVNADDPLYNFINKYTTVHPPCYIAGYQAFFSQSKEQFYNAYPMLNNSELVGTGDGVTSYFTGTLSAKPLLQNNVTFTSIDANNGALILVDVPIINPVTGLPTTTGNLITPNTLFSYGTIDYVTGAYAITMTTPALGKPIYCQAVPYTAARPMAILYFDDYFQVRPVPDMPYRIELEAYIRPTELLTATQSPELAQWWQYIAYGAAIKVFQDRIDYDSIAMIMPEYKHQERLVTRKTIVQMSNERVSTIFTEQGNGITGGGFGGGLF